ncbi:hypothetical protein ACFL47_09910, partial [Candidatus Latescibacterota bacterium]
MSLLPVVTLVVGICIGFGIAYFLKIIQTKTGKEIADEFLVETQEKIKEEREVMIESLKASFGDISLEVLNKTTDQVLKVTEDKFKSERTLHTKELDNKKIMIDDQLKRMTT